jgi:3-phosphoshikimate 1-carboxyvinyltransferase
MRARVTRASAFRGAVTVPGDKSISHRALMLAALSDGRVEIGNLSPGADVRSTARCLEALGASVEIGAHNVVVRGVGQNGLREPQQILDCGNSGTTMRLLAGMIAGARLQATLDGDESLRRRPMQRVLEPLRAIGALGEGRRDEKGRECAPLHFERGPALRAHAHALNISSAQVKSCLLLAGLFAEGETSVREPQLSRDHTERMLPLFGVAVSADPIALRGPSLPLRAPERLVVPGDFSSAAFLIAAALLVPDADLVLTNVSINPTRTGFLRTLQLMGGNIEIEATGEHGGDPVATIRARSGGVLRGIDIGAADIPSQVDEIPMLAIVASQAEGVTSIRGAGELRVKESDRLYQVALGLRAMGARVEELPDGLIVEGGARLHGANIETAHDHRLAMGFTVAGLCADGETIIEGAEWADISYPGYFSLLAELTRGSVATSP